MKTEMNGLLLRVAGGGGRNTDSRQTKAFQAPACVAGSVLAVLSPQSGGRYVDVWPDKGRKREKVL